MSDVVSLQEKERHFGKREGFEHLSVEIEHYLDHGMENFPSSMSTSSEFSDTDSLDSGLSNLLGDWQPVRERRMSFDFFSFPVDYDSATGPFNCGLVQQLGAMHNIKNKMQKVELKQEEQVQEEVPEAKEPLRTPRKSTTAKTSEAVSPPQPLTMRPLDDLESESDTEDQRNGRIGIYNHEERRARIEKFHAKRKRRVWKKKIKYDCRKKLADDRPRVKGRFVKRGEDDECPSVAQIMKKQLEFNREADHAEESGSPAKLRKLRPGAQSESL